MEKLGHLLDRFLLKISSFRFLRLITHYFPPMSFLFKWLIFEWKLSQNWDESSGFFFCLRLLLTFFAFFSFHQLPKQIRWLSNWMGAQWEREEVLGIVFVRNWNKKFVVFWGKNLGINLEFMETTVHLHVILAIAGIRCGPEWLQMLQFEEEDSDWDLSTNSDRLFFVCRIQYL